MILTFNAVQCGIGHSIILELQGYVVYEEKLLRGEHDK